MLFELKYYIGRNKVIEVDKNSIVFTNIDFNMNWDRLFYFYRLDFSDVKGNKYKDYDIWISD